MVEEFEWPHVLQSCSVKLSQVGSNPLLMKMVITTWNSISEKVKEPQLLEEVEQWSPWEGS